MTASTTFEAPADLDSTLSEGARKELDLLGIAPEGHLRERPMQGIEPVTGRSRVPRRDIRAPEVLNEAYDYASAFSRGLRVDLGSATLLLLSGTASIDDQGRTLYPDDFRAQCLRTYRNLTGLLAAENASWHDVVRTTCYLRDIERDYDTFNEIRTMFLQAVGVDPLPASTGIQARLCRSDLLVEIEAMAVVPMERAR